MRLKKKKKKCVTILLYFFQTYGFYVDEGAVLLVRLHTYDGVDVGRGALVEVGLGHNDGGTLTTRHIEYPRLETAGHAEARVVRVVNVVHEDGRRGREVICFDTLHTRRAIVVYIDRAEMRKVFFLYIFSFKICEFMYQ